MSFSRPHLFVLFATALTFCVGAEGASGTALQSALSGSWVGTLEYRDYSEAATSLKRVKLPTWLRVETTGADLQFQYVYDDGPAKTVTEKSTVTIDASENRYVARNSDGKTEEKYSVAGIGELRDGRGTLTLTGEGTENKTPVNVRTTMRIGRNILEILRETGVSGQPFTFRHAYTFVRATPPGTNAR